MFTYSFTDVSMIISHPDVGQYTATGEGTSSINVAMTTDRTVHDIAADSTVMISKVPGRNGTITVMAQQSSNLHAWLLKWHNYVEAAPTNRWALASIIIHAPEMGDLLIANNVSPQKLPDRPYQAQGQNVTWTLLAADIQQESTKVV